MYYSSRNIEEIEKWSTSESVKLELNQIDIEDRESLLKTGAESSDININK